MVNFEKDIFIQETEIKPNGYTSWTDAEMYENKKLVKATEMGF